jgi:hypothetical protein
MGRKMDFEEYISFEETLMNQEKQTWETAPARHKKVRPDTELPPGVYFLVDSSFIMLLKRKGSKTNQ